MFKFGGPRHWNISSFGPLNEVTSQVGKTVSACFAPSRYAPVTECPPITSQIRSPVVGDVNRHVTAGLRQCNTGISMYLLQQLHSVMNAAAQLVFSSSTSRFAHITPRLWQLHLLRLHQQSGLISSWLFLCTVVCREQHRRTESMISTMRPILMPGDVYALPRFRY